MLPLLLGCGLRLTPDLDVATDLTLLRSRVLPEGAVENVYAVG